MIVGMDVHRNCTQMCVMDRNGREVRNRNVVTAAGPSLEVVVEATFGWYWLVDLLQENGCRVHLASPSQLNWEGDVNLPLVVRLVPKKVCPSGGVPATDSSADLTAPGSLGEWRVWPSRRRSNGALGRSAKYCYSVSVPGSARRRDAAEPSGTSSQLPMEVR